MNRKLFLHFKRFALNSTHTWMHRRSYSTFRILCFKIFCGSRYPPIQSNLLYLIHMGVNCNNVFALSCSSIIVNNHCMLEETFFISTHKCLRRLVHPNGCELEMCVWHLNIYSLWVLGSGRDASEPCLHTEIVSGWLAGHSPVWFRRVVASTSAN